MKMTIYETTQHMSVHTTYVLDYPLIEDFSSINGLEHRATDIINGEAPSYFSVDFGFHTTSMELSDQRIVSDNPEEYLVVSQEMTPRRAKRPEGSATGSTPVEPIGDVLLPMMLMILGYAIYKCFFRARLHQ